MTRVINVCGYNLFDLGFSHVWANQSTLNPSALLYSMKAKLKERFISFWKKTIVI